MADQQHPSRLIDKHDRHRRPQRELVPDHGSQPGYVRSDTHLRNLNGRLAAAGRSHFSG